MILAMLLAHLVGDYILQWDDLSRWKSERLSGVLVHGSIILGVTLLFSYPFDPNFWPWAVFIAVTHTLIDAVELPIRRRLTGQESGKSALFLFLADQTAHLTIIALALIGSGYLVVPTFGENLATASKDYPLLTFLVAYAFLTMPAWILIKFLVYPLMNGSAPDFSRTFGGKYFSMLERGAITTLIIFGQFILIPLVAIPRLVFQWTQASGGQTNRHQPGRKRNLVHAAELIASVALAVAIGLGLRQIL
jgi:hypothetical protein